MTNEVTTLKKNLLEEMRKLQSDASGASAKKQAYQNIVDTVNKLQELDKGFEFNSKSLEPFSAFRPDNIPKIMKRVKWSTVKAKFHDEVKQQYNQYVTLAVEIVHERHPELDTDSDKFGTIVNATVANLIAMWK